MLDQLENSGPTLWISGSRPARRPSAHRKPRGTPPGRPRRRRRRRRRRRGGGRAARRAPPWLLGAQAAVGHSGRSSISSARGPRFRPRMAMARRKRSIHSHSKHSARASSHITDAESGVSVRGTTGQLRYDLLLYSLLSEIFYFSFFYVSLILCFSEAVCVCSGHPRFRDFPRVLLGNGST